MVIPRRAVLAAGLATAGVFAGPRGALATEEGGEGGEGAVLAALPPEIEFLVQLYLFDATYRIVGALYAEGQVDVAVAQLEGSHHAFYEDIAEGVAEHGAGFADEVQGFAELVTARAEGAAVAASLSGLEARIAAVAAAFSPAYRMQAIETLVRVAALDYAGGVSDTGEILSDHEYRDAWGFVQTARAELAALAASGDGTVAAAAERAIAALDGADALFDGLVATQAPGADPTWLHGAAARIEIARLRLG
jgi:hypothetical protein